MANPASEKHDRFLSLLRPIERELEGYARRMLWEPDGVEDALQTAALRAFAAFDRYHDDGCFRAWMFKILTREIFAMNRRHTRRARFEFQIEPAELAELAGADDSLAGSFLLDWQESLDDRLAAALRSLPENERAALLMRALGGLAYREIAEALAMPLGSMMGYLSRARKTMCALIAKQKQTGKEAGHGL